MSSTVQRLLTDIQNLNVTLCESIASGNWAEASQTENERRRALEELFALPLQAEARRQVLATLGDISESDRQLVRHLEEAREHCSKQISMMQVGRLATSSYESTGLMVNSPKMMQ